MAVVIIGVVIIWVFVMYCCIVAGEADERKEGMDAVDIDINKQKIGDDGEKQ